MTHAIERREVDERLVGRSHAPRQLVDLRVRTMRQKDGPGLRPQLDHVTRAIVFLVLPRSLVLLDDVAVVLGERIARRHARLAVAVRVEMIEIERRAPLPRQTARPASARDTARRQCGTRCRRADRCRRASRFRPATRGENSTDCRAARARASSVSTTS